MKSIKDMSDNTRKVFLKLRMKNEKYLDNDTDITQIRIEDVKDYRFSAIVYTKQWAPERRSLNFKNRLFANEFLLLQKLEFNVIELIPEA